MKKLLKFLVVAAVAAALCWHYQWAFRDLANSRSMSVEDQLYHALMEERETILLLGYELSDSQLADAWNHVMYTNADLFFVADQFEYTVINDRVLTVSPRYAVSGSQLSAAREIYEAAIADILSGVQDDWSQLETALYLHDYLCMHYAYDETLSRYSAYELLTEGTGVCQAYTVVYTALLQACGIECSYVVSEEMNHTWNIVYLDGVPYNVDITYDDPTGARLGRAKHANFLKSDAAFDNTHNYTAAEGMGQCTDTSYDSAVWDNATSAFVPLGDDFYFIEHGTIHRWDGETVTEVFTIYATWFTDRGDGTYWQGNHSTLWAVDGGLLYNTNNRIMFLDPAIGVARVSCGYYGDGDIYGFAYNGDSITLQVGTDPNEAGEYLTVTSFTLY